jgi:hypothetical protein
MQFEPVLLKTSLRAVLGWIVQALWARIVRYELLIELLAALVLRIKTVLLLSPNMLEWTLIVSALADVDHLVIGRLRYLHLLCLVLRHFHLLHLHLLFCVSNARRLHHHARLVHEAALSRVEAYSWVATDPLRTSNGLQLL